MFRYTHARVADTTRRINGLNRLEIVCGSLTVIVSVLFLATITIERPGLFYSNQHTYFPAGLSESERPFAQTDWFSQTRPPHISFTLLTSILDRLQILTIGVGILQILLEASLLLAIWLIVRGLYNGVTGSRGSLAGSESRLAMTTAAFCLLILGMQHPSALRDQLIARYGNDILELGQIWEWTFALGGLAAQYIWGHYLQPSEFGILIFLAIGVMMFERWRLGALFAGLTTFMHAGYLPHTGILIGVAAVWLIRSGRRRPAVEAVTVFGLVALPVTIYAITFMFQPESSSAFDILANFRTPHHSVPAEWWSNTSLAQLALMAFAGLLLVWKKAGFLAWVMVAGFAYTAASIPAVMITGNDALAFSHPWRGSTYLAPLSLFVIVAFGVSGVFRLVQRSSHRPVLLGWAAIAVAVPVLVATVYQLRDAEPGDDQEPRSSVAAMVNHQTAPDAVTLVPDNWYDFRLAAQRPIYVDFKSHPYLASEVMEWWRRLQTNRHFYTATERERGMICTAERIDYYVISTDTTVRVHREIASADGYKLVACPSHESGKRDMRSTRVPPATSRT